MAAYWIAHVTIHDPTQYQHYMALAPAAFQAYNARFLARGGEATSLEGAAFQKHVLIEFDAYLSALDCYHSEALSARPRRTRRRSGSDDHHRGRAITRH